MENLLKEDTIFEEVKLKSESFVHTNPLIDSYRIKEADEYFNKRMLDYDLISKITGLSAEEILKL